MSPENPFYPSPFSFYFPLRNALVSFVPVIGGMEIKSLQAGTFILTTETQKSHTITEVNKNYSIVILEGLSPAGVDLMSSFCRLKINNDTSIQATRGNNAHDLTVGYMVIEFDGLPQMVQHPNIVCDAVQENTCTITEVNLDKTLLIPNGVENFYDDIKACLPRIWFLNSTTVKCRFEIATGYKCAMFCVLSLP